MEAYDALSGGVEPGGLRSRNEIKILLCSLLNRLEEPIGRDKLCDAITREGIANYFELTQALTELIDNGNIDLDDEYNLSITEVGSKNAAELERDVPFTVREQAYNSAIMMLLRLKREKEHRISITKLENGCNISMSVVDGDDELMKISLFTADYEQALAVKEKFLSNPADIYSQIVALLMA